MNVNSFDKQANTLDRLRRSMQKLGKGGIIGTIPVSAPITNNGSTISLTLANPDSGLVFRGGGLSVGSDSTLRISGSTLSVNLNSNFLSIPDIFGIQVRYNSTGGLASTTTGLTISTALATTAPLTGGGNLSTGLTIAIPLATSTTNGYLSSTDWTAFHSGGATPIIAADASIVVASSTGSTTLKVQETSTGGISTAGTGIGILLGSTSGTNTLVDTRFSTFAVSTNLYTIGGNGSTWWTVASGAGGFSIGSTLNSTCLQTLYNYAQSISTSGNFYVAQYVPALSLGAHYQVTAVVRNDNGKASGLPAAVGFHIRLPATGTATSTSGMALVVYSDALWLYQNFGTLVASTAVSIGGADHTVMLDVNGNTFTVFLDGVSQFSSTSSHDSGNSGVGLFAGWDTQNTSTGVKEFMVSSVAGSNTYSGLQLAASGLSVLPNPNGGITVLSTGIGVHGFSTVAADPGTPADGDVWYQSTAQAFRVRQAGLTLAPFMLFDALTANGTSIVNSSTKTATFTSQVIPANFWTPRMACRVTYHGQYSNSTATTLAVDLVASTSAGLTSISGNSVFTAAAPATSANFGGTLVFVCRTAGSTGSFSLQGDYLFDNAAHTFQPAFQQPTLDTTKAWKLLLMLTWNAVNANDTATATDCVVEIAAAPY